VGSGAAGEISRERHRDRISAVRRRLSHDGPPWTRDRAGDFQTVTVPEPDCDALRDLLIAEGAETVIEVGLAYGSSALAIGEALVPVPQGSRCRSSSTPCRQRNSRTSDGR